MEEIKKTDAVSRKAAGTKKRVNVAYMVKIALLAAISTLLMLFEFPLPFAPSFYELDFSEVAVLIGGFALGPLAGVLIELLKVLLNLLINGSMTAGIGELANFIIGCSFVLPAALLYKHKKGLKSAIIAMAVGTASITVVGSLMNLFVLLPAYSALGIMPMDAIIKAGSAINGSITSIWTFVLLATAPFNLLKGVLVSLITGLLYKHISPILHKEWKRG